MKIIPCATRALALLIARRANTQRFGSPTGREAVEEDRKTGGIHVPLEQCTTSHEAGIAQHPQTGMWHFRTSVVADIAASDRSIAVDAVDSEWEPPR